MAKDQRLGNIPVPRTGDRTLDATLNGIIENLLSLKKQLETVKASGTTVIQQVSSSSGGVPSAAGENVFIQADDPGAFSYPILWIKLVGPNPDDLAVILRTP